MALLFFVVLAGLCANLNDDEEKVSLCYMYAMVLMSIGLFQTGLKMLVEQRDLIFPQQDPVTLFYIFYQSVVAALINMFAISKFVYAKNQLYRLVSIPLSITVIYNISVPIENLFYGTHYIWNLDYIIPSLCVVEVILLFMGSDFVRDKHKRSRRADDIHRDITLYGKAFNHRD